MSQVRSHRGDRALLRSIRQDENRKEKDIVHDAILLYSKSREHKSRVKDHKEFVKRRGREDKAKAAKQAREIAEKAARDEASQEASARAERGLPPLPPKNASEEAPE